MTDSPPQEFDDSPRLAPPIKVRWRGDSRSKWETRTLEPIKGTPADKQDDVTPDDADCARRANARQSSQVVVKTEWELAAVLYTLKLHAEFCGPYGAAWGSSRKKAAAERVRHEIREAAEDRDVDPDAAVDEYLGDSGDADE